MQKRLSPPLPSIPPSPFYAGKFVGNFELAGVEKKSTLAELKLASGGQSAKGIEQQMGYTPEELHRREEQFSSFSKDDLLFCAKRLVKKLEEEMDRILKKKLAEEKVAADAVVAHPARASSSGRDHPTKPEVPTYATVRSEERVRLDDTQSKLNELVDSLTNSHNTVPASPSPGSQDTHPEFIKEIMRHLWTGPDLAGQTSRVTLPLQVVGSGVSSMLRKLPNSDKEPGESICAIQALTVFKAAGIEIDHLCDEQKSPKTNELLHQHLLAFAVELKIRLLNARLLHSNGDLDQEWERIAGEGPEKLGKALKRAVEKEDHNEAAPSEDRATVELSRCYPLLTNTHDLLPLLTTNLTAYYYSLLITTYYLLLTTYYSLLTTYYYSLLTTYSLLLATHYLLLLTTYYLLQV